MGGGDIERVREGGGGGLTRYRVREKWVSYIAF